MLAKGIALSVPIHQPILTPQPRQHQRCGQRLRSLMSLMLLILASLLAVSEVAAVMPDDPPPRITQQAVDVTVSPKAVGPGETLTFTYKVYPDTIPPFRLRDAQVKLSILPFISGQAVPSLVHDSFSHLDAYVSKANQGGKIPTTLARTVNDAQQTVTYSIGDLGIDSLRQTADTLVFIFSYSVTNQGFTECLGLVAGVEAEFFADIGRGQRSFGSKFPTSEVKAKSDIDWDFVCDPFKDPYEQRDSLELKITYRNHGDVEDIGTFSLVLQPPLTATAANTEFVELPPPITPADIRFAASGDSIIINVSAFPPDDVERVIRLKIRFVIRRSSQANLVVKAVLQSDCDADAQQIGGDIIPKTIRIDLANLVSIQKSASPAVVSPGGFIDYVLTITRQDAMPLDSVIVIDQLGLGVLQIENAVPPLSSNDQNHDLTWRLGNMSEVIQEIRFRAIIRPDYYSFLNFTDRDSLCKGVIFSNSVVANAFQADIDEGVVGDNDALAFTKINGIGDVLSIAAQATKISGGVLHLPGDVLQFTVAVNNPSSFRASTGYTLEDVLPDRQFVSSPFDMSPPTAVYDGQTHAIRLTRTSLDAGASDSLVFKVRFRDDVQVCADTLLFNRAQLSNLVDVDCDSSNNAQIDTLLLSNPQTTLDFTVDIQADEVNPNDEIEILLSYTNASTSLIPIKGLSIADTLANGMNYISSEPPADSVSGQFLFWQNLPALPPGETGTIRVRAQVVALEPCKAETLVTAAGVLASPAPCALNASLSDLVIMRGTDNQLSVTSVPSVPDGSVVDANASQRIEYVIPVVNNSNFVATDLVITDVVPAAGKFTVDPSSISPSASFDGSEIVWQIASLAMNDSVTLRFAGTLIDQVYCATDSIINTVSLFVDQFPSECQGETIFTKHYIQTTPEDLQPQVTFADYSFTDSDGDKVFEPNECGTLTLSLTAGAADFTNVAFCNDASGTDDSLAAVIGDVTIFLKPESKPTAIAANTTAQFVFSFQAPEVITAATMQVEGFFKADQNCGQPLTGMTAPTRGNVAFQLMTDLVDASGDGFVLEGEVITATIRLTNTSSFAADSSTLAITLGVTPGRAELVLESSELDPNDLSFRLPVLEAGADTTIIIRFLFPDLMPENQLVIASSTVALPGFNVTCAIEESVAAAAQDDLRIKHECFARPRTFIPAEHPAGLKFKPNDDLPVIILDADGNKVWEGTTRQTWNGNTSDGRPVPPGTYLWAIADQCKGAVVVLR